MCGIEKSSMFGSAIIANACRRNYGIVVDKPYSGVTSNPTDLRRQGVTNRMVAAAQIHWFISKGDLVLPNEPRTRYEFTVIVEDGNTSGEVKIWSCDLDEGDRPYGFYQNRESMSWKVNPSLSLTFAGLEEAAVLRYDLSHIAPDDFGPRHIGADQRPFRIAHLTIVVGFKDSELRGAVKFKDLTLTSASIQY
jgi:hypothetical protein